jgi:hypothetical protein
MSRTQSIPVGSRTRPLVLVVAVLLHGAARVLARLAIVHAPRAEHGAGARREFGVARIEGREVGVVYEDGEIVAVLSGTTRL